MPNISLVVAVDQKGAIGKDNQLLWHLPADLKHFKSLTIHKPIIMGRRTFLSIGKPLPHRKNIVLSRTMQDTPGVVCVGSISEAFEQITDEAEVMVIGGAEIFELFMPYAKTLYLTEVQAVFPADTYFTGFKENEWTLIDSHSRMKDESNPYEMIFKTFTKNTEKSEKRS